MKTWVKLVLIFGVIAVIVGWMLFDAEQREARLTAKGEAVVTAVELKEDIESDSLDETEFALTLQAGGSEVATTDTLPGDRTDEFRAGHVFTVCYNPQDPREVDIELDASVTCGG